MNPDSLQQSVTGLFTLLHKRQIEYALVGGVALLQYVDGRNTQDLDLIMALSVLEKLPEIEVKEQDSNFARGEFEGLQIDILLTKNALFAKVQHAYKNWQDFAEYTIPTASVAGLILLKLYALPSLYRQGNFARIGLYENDIATLMHYYNPDMTPLLSELSQHLSHSDMDEIQEIIGEIEQRIARFQKGTNK